jgi:hypothetical protein
MMYYKRYRPAEKTHKTVYQAVQNKGVQPETKTEYPVDRTL